jgi:hypothetical protein
MTPRASPGWVVSGVVAGALALSGCGSDDPAPATATTTATPTPAAATLPADVGGSYTRTMTDKDWKSYAGSFPSGKWRFDVKPNGDVDVYPPGADTVDFTTAFHVTGDRVTIDSVPVCPNTTGRYRWHASGKALTLTVAKDTGCPPRAVLFGGTWHRR